MLKWRSLNALLALSSAVACATATNTAVVGDPGDSGGDGGSGAVASGAGDNSMVVSPSGGSPSGGSPSGGSPSGGSGGASHLAFGGGTGLGGSSSGGAGGGAGAAPSGGGAGTSAGGAASGGAGGSSGGTGAGGDTSTGPCANPMDVKGGNSMNLGTLAAVCLRTKETFNTVGCSNFAGRTLKVNGVAAKCDVKTAFPAAISSYNYFDISAGTVSYASINWYTQ